VASKSFEMKCQVAEVRGKRFFICDYTGAPIEKRYFVPSGRFNRGKMYCCATLPILLRLLYEEEGGRETPTFYKFKTLLEEYFHQPDIPVQPPLPPEKVPLSKSELFDYLLELDQGEAWLHVDNAHEIASAEPVNKKIKH